MVGEQHLPRSTPEEQGIPSSAVLDFVAAAQERIDAVHAFVLVRHGHVVAEGAWAPYQLDRPRALFSLSKSFTSTAVGLAVAEGHLSTDDPVLQFFPEAAPAAVSDNLRRLRLHDLLIMTTGHTCETLGALTRQSESDWARSILALPVDHEPGTHFAYNSGASYLLSAIVQRVTGQTLLDYLRPRLLHPLGITDATWQSCPRGINVGGWGLTLRPTEIARFGQLYLQQGTWRGQQLIPRTWVADATARRVSNDNEGEPDWRQGYGYQSWRCRHDAYRGDGAFGQFCVVMPEQDAVLVVVSGVSNMQAVLNLAWDHHLPAMGGSALPGDSAARHRLEERLSALSRQRPAGRASSSTAARVAGRTFRVRTQEGEPTRPRRRVKTITWDVAKCESRLRIEDESGVHDVWAGVEDWRPGPTTLRGEDDDVAASASWTDDDTWTMHLAYVAWPFTSILTLRFVGDQVTMTERGNVSGDPNGQPAAIVGYLD